MATRTDLALEQQELCGECRGAESHTECLGRIEITRTRVLGAAAAKAFQKPVGQYITVSFDRFLPDDQTGELHEAIKAELTKLLPKGDGLVLVAGLGNRAITPDALGPKAADGIFATRHVSAHLQKALGLPTLRPVVALQPGVLGQTGMEACEMILAAVKETNPEVVIVIDALAARHFDRLGCTVQLCDSGICPGSGVHNSRQEISQKTLNVPVIAVGVPTVVDADRFLLGEPPQESGSGERTVEGQHETAADINKGSAKKSEKSAAKTVKKTDDMMVTPREIDTVIEYAAKTVSHAINCALQPELDPEILLALNY